MSAPPHYPLLTKITPRRVLPACGGSDLSDRSERERGYNAPCVRCAAPKWYNRYVANKSPCEGVGPQPALLLDRGQLPPTTLCLCMGGSKETQPCSPNESGRTRN
jgi:hypothetical protein